MKKILNKINNIIFLLIIFICFSFILSSCNRPTSKLEDIKLSILSINDFHGQLEEDDGQAGAARIAQFIFDSKAENPEGTLLLAAGDMFQGTGISNVGYGLDVVNFMNMVGFDAMTVGNHEFDWGLDEVLKYRDGISENGEANFPFLSSNIISKKTNNIPNYIDEYTIVERSGLKIAIIGFIGYDQTADIATSMISDYEFLQPLEIVKENIKKARTSDEADVVIICCHEDNPALNNLLADGTNEYEVDAIINAHSHDLENKRIYRASEQKYVPVVQSSSSGEYVGLTTLVVDPVTKDVKESAVRNVKMTSNKAKNNEVEAFVSSVVYKYAPIFSRVLCKAGAQISRTSGTNWAVKALFEYTNTYVTPVDVAFINSGGIRANAFPIYEDENVTVNKVYQIMPFDNTIKTTKLTGKQLKQAFKISDGVSAGNFSIINGVYYINNEEIDDDSLYSVVAIDFIFDKTQNPFVNGQDTVATGILFRDVLIKILEIKGQNNEAWLG